MEVSFLDPSFYNKLKSMNDSSFDEIISKTGAFVFSALVIVPFLI